MIPGWDGAGEKPLEIQEAPVIWMDRALSKYAGVEDPEAWISEGVTLADACRATQGLWVGVWHPNLTPALGFPDAPAAFAALLDRLLAQQPFMAPLGSRSSVIFDLDQDGDLDIITNDFNSEPQVLVSNLSERQSIHWLKVVPSEVPGSSSMPLMVVPPPLPDPL